MKTPDGLAEYLGLDNNLAKEYCLELTKSMYGLKVSPKRWFFKFCKTMKRMRFIEYPLQPCLYMWKQD